MSFTIKCDKCGNFATFNTGDTRNGDKIQVIPDIHFMEYTVNSVDIYCENDECNNDVELK